jgi:hypothetical protein
MQMARRRCQNFAYVFDGDMPAMFLTAAIGATTHCVNVLAQTSAQ